MVLSYPVMFTGTDPATDLRGVGLLGLYQLMFLVTSSETEQLGQKIYQLSTDKKQQFPFCVMGTNVTAIALHTLREGHLNKEFNRRKSESVIKLFNLFFCGLYCRLYNKWKNGRKTVADAGFVLKELRTEATRNVADTMDFVFALDNKESSKRTKRDATESERKSNDANGDVNCTQFSDIGNVFDDDNQCDIDSDGSGSHQERAIM
ncbi:ELMO domain-containing protein 3 [Halotydeus destructor]|nr:ELMO domain-containing protein 3 [Halotydeus destructor]